MERTAQPRVDVAFKLAGLTVPLDHGYALFGALCRILGDLHGAEWLAVHPIAGVPRTDGLLGLHSQRGALRLRVPPDDAPRVLPLAGKDIELDGHRALVGTSGIFELKPAAVLHARIVVIKGFTEPEPFTEAVRRQLEILGVTANITVGRRRVLTISGKRVIGFATTLSELGEESSLRVQYAGVGGRQRMGCGVFALADGVSG